VKYPQVEHSDLSKPYYRAWKSTLRSMEGKPADEVRQKEKVDVDFMLRWAYELTPGYRALYLRRGWRPST